MATSAQIYKVFKKIKINNIIIIGAVVFLSGCGESATTCDDSKAKELVLQIYKKHAFLPSEPTLENIRTTSIEDKLKKSPESVFLWVYGVASAFSARF